MWSQLKPVAMMQKALCVDLVVRAHCCAAANISIHLCWLNTSIVDIQCDPVCHLLPLAELPTKAYGVVLCADLSNLKS